MAEYTYADVIIDPNDPRVEIGAKYCFGDIPQNLVEAANSDNDFWERLEEVSVSEAFNFKKENGGWKSCIIRKKEPKKKYVPFDLSDEEDRAKLRGAWVREKDGERELSVTAIYLDEKPPFVELNDNGFTAEQLLESYKFLDGSPCGRLVEE